jgi:hypothetical protein
MSDDPPSDKGKQKADVEMVDALDQPRTSAAPDGDTVEASTGWLDFVELALVHAEEELRTGVAWPSNFGMRPILMLSLLPPRR